MALTDCWIRNVPKHLYLFLHGDAMIVMNLPWSLGLLVFQKSDCKDRRSLGNLIMCRLIDPVKLYVFSGLVCCYLK